MLQHKGLQSVHLLVWSIAELVVWFSLELIVFLSLNLIVGLMNIVLWLICKLIERLSSELVVWFSAKFSVRISASSLSGPLCYCFATASVLLAVSPFLSLSFRLSHF